MFIENQRRKKKEIFVFKGENNWKQVVIELPDNLFKINHSNLYEIIIIERRILIFLYNMVTLM